MEQTPHQPLQQPRTQSTQPRNVHLAYKNSEPSNEEGYMMKRTRLTISKVMARRNPVRMNAIPAVDPSRIKPIDPNRQSNIMHPITQREYPRFNSSILEILSSF